MTRTALLKSSTAVQVVKSSPKLPAVKREREYRDFDAFVANGDKLVAFFKVTFEQHINRLCEVQFKWLKQSDCVVLDLERAKRDIARARCAVDSVQRDLRNLPQIGKRLAEFKRDAKWYDRKELYEIKSKGRRKERTLSRRVIAEQMALLLASFPNAKPGTPKVFGRMLTEDIYAADTDPCVLESACRRVRRYEEFVSIAKVLKAIKTESHAWADRWELLNDDADFVRQELERLIADAEGEISKAEAKLAEREAKAKAAEEKRRLYREAYERMPADERRAFEHGQRARGVLERYRPEMPAEFLAEGREREFAAYLAGLNGEQIPGLELRELNGKGPDHVASETARAVT